MAHKESYGEWDTAEFLEDRETIVECLQAALEENDPEFFVRALGHVARANATVA